MDSPTGIIILAAGSSSRLGRPKQLLAYRGRNLITHVITEAVRAGVEPIVVVTGAFAQEVRAALPDKSIEIVFNPLWETGMASGLAAGLARILMLRPDIKAVIVAVCDQPYISAALLRQLVDKRQATGKGIIASGYADTSGTPVLFSQRYFEALAVLTGNEGAKKLLRQHQDEVYTVPFPKGEIDIDTEEDYRRL
jgi:molybdenum cofactor cytidylyltransferase